MMISAEAEADLLQSIRKGLRKGSYFRLLPRHHVHLFAPNGKDGARFAGLFQATWKRLPFGARRRVLKHWRSTPIKKHFLLHVPAIELLDGWSQRERGRGLRGDWAFCHRTGCRLLFWTRIVAAMPDNLVCDLIAHEVAHVDQWACGWDLANDEDNYTIEEDAELRVRSWGFSSDAMDEWARSKGIIKRIDLEKLSPRQQRRYLARARRAGR